MSNIEVNKQTIFEALSTISGLNVYNTRPNADMQLPCVTFKMSDLKVEIDLSKDISNQSDEFTLDFFAEKSVDVTAFFISVEAVMRNLGYVLVFAGDVEDPDDVRHINARFNLF